MRALIKVLGFILPATALTLGFALPGGGAPGSENVTIVAGQFDPKEVTVEVGDEVTWTNKDDDKVHSVTADDGSFDSSPECSNANPGKCLDDRHEFTHTFTVEGRFPYYSRTSGAPGGQGTAGTVVVVPVGTPVPDEPPPTTTTTFAP